MIGIIAS